MLASAVMFVIVVVITLTTQSVSCGSIDGMCQHVCQMYRDCSGHCGERPPVVVGPIGPRGPPGIPGRVNYARINDTIEDRIGELRNRLEELEKLLTWTKATNGYFYKVFPTGVDYAAARTLCAEKGGILASVGPRDAGVRQELAAILRPYARAWIGVNDIERKGTWVWEDGVVSDGRDIDWIQSPQKQPDNLGGKEDCAEMLGGRYNWKVNDHSCNGKFPALCERRPV